MTALCAALFLTGLASIPPTDRDEARFMQATKQMIETGDFVAIRFQEEARTKKPVGIHWLQALSVKTLAGSDLMAAWADRLPSAAAAWLSVLCVFALGRRLFDARAGVVAAGLLVCALVMVAEAHLAKTDAVLLLTVVLAHMALAEVYLAKDSDGPPLRRVLLFWLAVGLGLLIKGPVILAVVSATIIALCIADRKVRWLTRLHPVLGIPVAAACVLPWIVLSALAGHGDIIWTSLTDDFFPKLMGGEEGHGAPPGTYTLLSPLLLWPAALVVLPGVIRAWQERSQPQMRFVLAWGIATWVMFEAVPTKLPHYILPAVPALALAAAGAVAAAQRSIPSLSKAVWCVVTVLLAAGLSAAAWTYDGPITLTASLAIVLVGLTDLVWTQSASKPAFIAVAAVIVFGLVFGGYLSQLNHLTLSTRLFDSVQAQGGGPIALTRYREPSAIYLLGTETWLTNTRNAAAQLVAEPSALAVIAEDELDVMSDLVVVADGTLIVLDHIAGFNYVKGRRESLLLVRSEPVSE